eukprot:TRINITY_DN185_c0_g1_i11.p2 TRINITY_DN185_c0_g1~~TRINITY_DN185_c0_g1_i11.p2  ORF type:complete len:318 (+),score=110.40 TRINITY_DN185_c0_g1_i11:59-1012(+)
MRYRRGRAAAMASAVVAKAALECRVPRLEVSCGGDHLGSGSMGAVRVGETGGLRVALKSFDSDAGAARELLVLSGIRHQPHPGLTACLGSCKIDGRLCAVLELMPGGSLDKVLRRGRSVPERWWRRYFEQLTGALAHLHSLGIMHLDVKGANILLSTAEAEQTSVVKLADFGESTRVGEATKTPKGTFTHMSPEAACGRVGTACDVWSLAVVGLEVEYGSAVEWWEAEHATTVSNMFAGLFTAMRREQSPAVPERLHPLTQSFLRSCLQIDPSDRPSAAELTRHEWFAADDECFDGAECARRTPRGAWSSTAGSASS